jgi:predicted GIY-YIG superfamily endonuclease
MCEGGLPFPSLLTHTDFMQWHVYILQSESQPEQIYTGFSGVNMDVRLARHNSGSTPSTKRYRPWKLAWHCSFPDKHIALDFEAYLKTGSGRAFMYKRLVRKP